MSPETPDLGRIRFIGRPSKYPDELRERAVRMVAGMLGIGTPETLRTWFRGSEVDSGLRAGVTSQMAEENKALRKEIAKLRRANEILKAAAVSSGPSSTGPGHGDSVHRRSQGQPASRP